MEFPSTLPVTVITRLSVLPGKEPNSTISMQALAPETLSVRANDAGPDDPLLLTVTVLVGVCVTVLLTVAVLVGVCVTVLLTVAVLVGVCVTVLLLVGVCVTVLLIVGVLVEVGVSVGKGSHLTTMYLVWVTLVVLSVKVKANT